MNDANNLITSGKTNESVWHLSRAIAHGMTGFEHVQTSKGFDFACPTHHLHHRQTASSSESGSLC